MKRIRAEILAFVMVLMLNMTVYADDASDPGTQHSIALNELSFAVIEETNKDYVVTRTFCKDVCSGVNELGTDEIKTVLMALGMKERTVDKLTVETLQAFAESSSIVVTTSYTKFNEDSGISTPVSRETALSRARDIQAAQENRFLQMVQNTSLRGTIDNLSDVPGEFRDSYMEVIHAAASQGDGICLFTVDATWLSMPFFRGYDSIGSCAMNATVTPNTRSGYYFYDIIMSDSTGAVTYSSTGNINITHKENDENGNWYGSAGYYDLPDDSSSEAAIVRHYNFGAHYQYEGHVNYPQLESWFNSVGNYDHATIGLNFEPSIEIEVGGEVSAFIGLDIIATVDSRPAEIEVHHIP